MATDAAVQVESSPTQILASLTPAETAKWRQTGDLPEPKSKEAPPEKKTEAASSTAAKESTEAPAKATETPAASVPAKKEEPKANAETRIKDLLAENKRLAGELETIRKAPVVAPAKVEEVAKPRRNDVDEKTGQVKYATDEAFDEAYEGYLTAKVTKDVETRHAKALNEARLAEQNNLISKRWLNSMALATEKYPDLNKILMIDDKGVSKHPEIQKIKSNGILDARILGSTIGAEFLHYLATHPGEVERIQSLTDPFEQSDEIRDLIAKLSTAPAKSAPTKEEKPASSPASKVTSAPAPATSVSGKATAPTDEVEAALKAEDFDRYQKSANEEDYRRKKKS